MPLIRILMLCIFAFTVSCKDSKQQAGDLGVQHDVSDVHDIGGQDVSEDVFVPDRGQEKLEKDDAGFVDVPEETTKDTLTDETSAPVCQMAVSGEKCYEGVGCAVVCADEAQACLTEVSASERPNADVLLDCISNSGCENVMEYEWFSECIEEKCKDKLDACFSGNGICNDVRKCRMACSPSDTSCPLRCLGLATPQEREVWKTYYICIMGADCVQEGDVMPNGWPTDTCERYAQHHFCPNQTQACIPPQ